VRASNAAPRIAAMSPRTLPPDVSAFIDQQIQSIDEIDVLMLLSEAPSRWWDAKLLGSDLGGLTVSGARHILDHLAALNLLDIRVTDAVRYRFQPGTDELTCTISRLVSAYKRDRHTVVRAIRRVARRDVRDFADAFRFRRDNGSR
jgi:hypothetical protein